MVEFNGQDITSSPLDGIIANLNPAAKRLFGYSSQEMVDESHAPDFAEPTRRAPQCDGQDQSRPGVQTWRPRVLERTERRSPASQTSCRSTMLTARSSAMNDHARMLMSCMEATSSTVDPADKVGLLVPEPAQLSAIRTTNVPAIRTTFIPAIRTTYIPAIRTTDIPAIRTTHIPASRTTNVPAILSILRSQDLLQHARVHRQVPGKCHVQRLKDGPDRLLLADEALRPRGNSIRHQTLVDRADQHDHLGSGAHLMDPSDSTEEAHVEQACVRLVGTGSPHRLIRIKGRGHHREAVLHQSHAQRVEQQPVGVADQPPHDSTARQFMAGSTMRVGLTVWTSSFAPNPPRGSYPTPLLRVAVGWATYVRTYSGR